MSIVRGSLLGLALLASLPVGGGWAGARAAEPGPGMAAPELPPCTCRAQGKVFDMGEQICLATPDGPRMALCAMDQNVTSWKPTAQTCPSASRRAPPGRTAA